MKISWDNIEEIRRLVLESSSSTDLLRRMGYASTSYSHNKIRGILKTNNIDHVHFRTRRPEADGMKECLSCHTSKPVNEFFSNGSYRGKKKYKPRCKNCDIIYIREGREEFLRTIVEMRCAICNYDKCIGALDFHHIDPTEKSFAISDSNVRDLDRLLPEIQKCAILCCRCHREYHAGLIDVDFEHQAVLI